MSNLVNGRNLSVAELDKLTTEMGTAAESNASLKEMNSESLEKICKGLTGTDLEGCIARNKRGARRKTRKIRVRRRRSTRRGGMGEKTIASLRNAFGFNKPPPQENPQDVARRAWCDANFGRIPERQLQCYQEAPDDVSSSKPWPANKKAGRRRTRRRGARSSRARPTR